MAFLAGIGPSIIVLLIALEVFVNCIGLYAASESLAGFRFNTRRAIFAAGLIYTVLHLLGGYLLGSVLAIGIFTGTGLAIGYFIDVFLLWITDKLLKDFEIRGKGPLFTGAFLLIFCWGVGWYVMLIALGALGIVDLKPIMNI